MEKGNGLLATAHFLPRTELSCAPSRMWAHSQSSQDLWPCIYLLNSLFVSLCLAGAFPPFSFVLIADPLAAHFTEKKDGFACDLLHNPPGVPSKETIQNRMTSCSNSQTSLFSLVTTSKCQCPVGKCLRSLQGLCHSVLATPGPPPREGRAL